jgi:hypothetical protein
MHRKFCKKQLSLVNRKGPILLHDNARPHTAQVTKNFLNELRYEVLTHPPYSPDLSPADYHFFFHPGVSLSKKKYTNSAQLKRAFGTFINVNGASFYKEEPYKLPSKWQKCIESNSSYFR